MARNPWIVGRGRAVLLDRPIIVAVVNVTPDSFFDGGRHFRPDAAVAYAIECLSDGADVLDIGPESTRPGAESIEESEQIRRSEGVIRRIVAARQNALISIDTTNAAVASACIEAGASIINDTSAGRDDPDMIDLASRTKCGVILMHRLHKPNQDHFSTEYPTNAVPQYEDVVAEVSAFLEERAAIFARAGVPSQSIAVDPGVGFGKTVEQNWLLAKNLDRLSKSGRPVVSAISRKSFLTAAGRLGSPDSPEDRLPATLAVSLAHRRKGASLFRVHDVRAHREAFAAAELAGEAWAADG